jgi:hypothetical protein
MIFMDWNRTGVIVDGTHFKISVARMDYRMWRYYKSLQTQGKNMDGAFSTFCYYYKGKIHNQENDSILKNRASGNR